MSSKPEPEWDQVDDFLTSALAIDDPILDACLAANTAADLPPIDVSPLQGGFLALLARIQGTRQILEIGTLGGYSTICLARTLPADGRLTTLELNPRHAEVAAANIARAGLADRVEIIVGPALDSLLRLQKENRGPFDFIFIDADKSGYPAYLKESLKLSRPGTVIVGDNVVRQGQVADSKNPDPLVQGARKFIEDAGANPALDTTVLQLVGQKGYDGMLIARVR
jgi:predicted O-methyltransferase YrrM